MSKRKCGKSGNQGTDRRVRVPVAGVTVETIDGTVVTKAGMKTLIGAVVGVGDRQQRGAVSSYVAEGWTLADGGKVSLHEPFTHVSSAVDRVRIHKDAAHDVRVKNVKRRTRAKKT